MRQQQLIFRFEYQFLGHVARLARIRVIRIEPSLGHKQGVIQQTIAVRPGIADHDQRMAVVRLAQMPAVLPLDAHRVLALLGEVTSIARDHAVGMEQQRARLGSVSVQHAGLVLVIAAHKIRHIAHAADPGPRDGDRLVGPPVQIAQPPLNSTS